MEKKTRDTDNPRDEVIAVQKKICSWAMTAVIVLALIFIVLDEKAIAKGLVLGTLFSIINFVLLGRSIPMTLGQSVGRARLIGLTSILCRYAVLAVPLILGIKLDALNFVAVVVGIFAVQIVTLVDYTIIKRFFDNK